MKRALLLDTGPLVALLDRRDHFHDWSREWFGKLPPPFHTCEAVITEACHLLRGVVGGFKQVMGMLSRPGAIKISFRLETEHAAVGLLMNRYANLPMSLADACLVRMSEIHSNSRVFTLDRDFRVYRKHGRLVVPTIVPNDL